MQGIKRKRRCELECQEHIFKLESLKGSYKYDTYLSFCPKYQRDPLPPEHTYPEFNNDLKFYTSAFGLGIDKRNLLKNQQQQLMDHQKMVRESLQKNNQLMFPRPNSKHTTCNVCKQQYKNYYFHIYSEGHKEMIKYSPYNQYINNLALLYKDLWEGAEIIADEQENRRLQELERQLNEQYDPKSNFEESQNLSNQPKENNDLEQSRKIKIKTVSSRQFEEGDTIPLIQRGISKKSSYSNHSDLRKKFINNSFEPLGKSKRSYSSKTIEEDDVFIIKRAYGPSTYQSHIHMPNPHKVNTTFNSLMVKKEKQFIWKKQSKPLPFVKTEEKRQNNVIQIKENSENNPSASVADNRQFTSSKIQQLHEKSNFGGYYSPHIMPPYLTSHLNSGQVKKSEEKGTQKQKQKDPRDRNPNFDNSMYYQHHQWQYPPPYYMPGMQMIPSTIQNRNQSEKTPQINTNNKQNSYMGGNTSININFPMCMYPPMNYMPNSRYPMPPMIHPPYSYQYPPQFDGKKGENKPSSPKNQ